MYSRQIIEELPRYTREIQHARMFRVADPSRPKQSIYLTFIKEISLRLRDHDT